MSLQHAVGLVFFVALIAIGCVNTGTRDTSANADTSSEPLDSDTNCIEDCDDDGVSIEDGDCDDTRFSIGPLSLEFLGKDGSGDGIDNDCDGQTDEIDACDCTETLEASVPAVDCSCEVGCFGRFLKEPSNIASPTYDMVDQSYVAIDHFGDLTNDLAPRRGSSYGHISTGIAGTQWHNLDLSGGFPKDDPFSSEDYQMHDVIEYTVKLKAPNNAEGFSFEYVFFSVEYDDYVGTSKNDKFYAILDGPFTTQNEPMVINVTECRDEASYYDFDAEGGCTLASGYCCYVAINTALSDCCWYNGCPGGTGGTDITGTGYECAFDEHSDDSQEGSSTGWLKTTWSIVPGEEFTLIFHLHDTDDGVFDSSIILDNFQWIMTPVIVGTSPVQ